MAHTSTFTLLDASGEKSSVRVHNGAITAVSIAGFLTAFGTLRTAIDGITLGTVHKEMWVGDDTVLSQEPPASPWAQRELKALIKYRGNTSNKIFTLEVPTIDLDAVTLLPGTDLIQLDDVDGENPGPMANFVTAFEAIGRSPDNDTETVTVLEARVVGRNL